MSEVATCRGLQASWLNGWMAAIGILVLVPEARLSWTDTGEPLAQFTGVDHLATRIHGALPSLEDLAASAIARNLAGEPEIARNFKLEAWRSRAHVDRKREGWHLAASASDLVELKPGDNIPHSPFDPPVPAGRTLHFRVIRCRAQVSSVDQIGATLSGVGTTMKNNGLGFDARRLATGIGADGKYVDPVVELLAFHALALFPARGSGSGQSVRTRGWTKRPTEAGAFTWPAWHPRLDQWGVDAFLDRYYMGDFRTVGVRYESVPYRWMGDEKTRAYAGRRIV